MNCQPSFSRESVTALDASLNGLGWLMLEPSRDVEDDGGIEDGRARTDRGEPRAEQPRRRVPDRDIIYVGPRPVSLSRSEPVDVRDLAFRTTPVDARLIGSSKIRAARRGFAKPLLALLVLELTVVGGFYVKKRYAESQVIFIPIPVSERSVIT